MARDNEPGAACLLGGGGTRKQQSLQLHPFLHPEPRSSQAHPRQGGVCRVSLGRELLLLCLVLGLPMQAELPQITPWRAGTGCAGFTSSPGTQQAPLPHEDRWVGAIPAAARPCWSRDEAGPSPSSRLHHGQGVVVQLWVFNSHNHPAGLSPREAHGVPGKS